MANIPIEVLMREHDVVRRTSYDKAKSEVEAKLRKQQLTKPLSEKEMDAFCEAMVTLSRVRGWALSWQSTWLRSSRI